MAGQLVRVVAGRTDHGEDTAGFRLDGHCGAIRAAEAVVCGLLNLRIDGRFDIGALVLLPGEQRLEPLPEQLLRLARQQRAAGRFDAAPATLADGEESGDRRIQFAGGIGTLVRERIVGRIGFCDDRSVRGENGPARCAVFVVQRADVTCVVGELVGSDGHDDGGGHAQNDEQGHHDGEQLAERLIHAMLLAGRSSAGLRLSESSDWIDRSGRLGWFDWRARHDLLVRLRPHGLPARPGWPKPSPHPNAYCRRFRYDGSARVRATP